MPLEGGRKSLLSLPKGLIPKRTPSPRRFGWSKSNKSSSCQLAADGSFNGSCPKTTADSTADNGKNPKCQEPVFPVSCCLEVQQKQEQLSTNCQKCAAASGVQQCCPQPAAGTLSNCVQNSSSSCCAPLQQSKSGEIVCEQTDSAPSFCCETNRQQISAVSAAASSSAVLHKRSSAKSLEHELGPNEAQTRRAVFEGALFL